MNEEDWGFGIRNEEDWGDLGITKELSTKAFFFDGWEDF